MDGFVNFGSGGDFEDDIFDEDIDEELDSEIGDEDTGEEIDTNSITQDVISDMSGLDTVPEDSYINYGDMQNFGDGLDDDDDYDEESDDHYLVEIDESDVTTPLKKAKPSPKKKRAAHKASRGIGRTVAVALAGVGGVVVALAVVMLVLQPMINQSVSDASTKPASVSQTENKEDTEEVKPSASILDEITDTGKGYGVTKLLADSSSETIALHGRIKNLGSELKEKVGIGIYLYDADGSIIGVATGFVDRIEPDEVCDFVAVSDVATSDVANVALTEVRW